MKAKPEETPEKTQGSGKPQCPTTAAGLGNRSAEVSQHLQGLCFSHQAASKGRSHQKPRSGRLTGVSTMAWLGVWRAQGCWVWVWPCPLSPWGMISAVPLPSWRGRAAAGLLCSLPPSLIILQRIRGRRRRRRAASKAHWPPPRSLPATLEPRPRGARPLVERDTRLRRATQLWLGKGRGRSPRVGKE